MADYLRTGESRWLEQAATFGGSNHQRPDRDDTPQGVFAGSLADYPYAAMRRAHERFYDGLRTLAVTDFFGFDVDVPGAGYADLLPPDAPAQQGSLAAALARVPGESLGAEAERLDALVEKAQGELDAGRLADLDAMVDALRYRLLADRAADYEATRPAMVWREDAMKRRLHAVLGGALGPLPEDALIVLLGHAFHLARDDAGVAGQGVGPGGGGTPSLGHWLNQEQSLATASVWMLYGAGRDSQPLKDLPNEARYPAASVNGRLGQLGKACVVPLADPSCPWGNGSGVGHLYNLVAAVDLRAQTDAVHFVPEVTPLT